MMILDTLRSAGYYFDLHKGIESAFAFISDAMRGNIEDGEYEIDGRDVFAIVSTCSGKGEGARLEAHKEYIDVQFCLEGSDTIGWSHIDECEHVDEEYDKEKDIMFFSDKALSRIVISGNTFAILFPHDAHAPLSGEGKCRKVVVKVRFR